jgi:WD40 repeat protein
MAEQLGTLMGNKEAVHAVGCTHLPDGTPIAVILTADRVLRLWDLKTRQPLTESLVQTEGTKSFYDAAYMRLLDGTPIALTRSLDEEYGHYYPPQVHEVEVWNLLTQDLLGVLPGDASAGVDGTYLPDGTPVAVTFSTSYYDYDPTVRVWDLTTFQPHFPRRHHRRRRARALGDPLSYHAARGLSVACSQMPNGSSIVATLSTRLSPSRRGPYLSGSMVVAWDLRTRYCLGGPSFGNTITQASELALTYLPDSTPIVVTTLTQYTGSGHYDHEAQVWGWPSQLRACLIGHTQAVRALACTHRPDGTPIAVTGSDDKTVRVWDLSSGQPLGDPLTEHTDAVRHVACTRLPDGTPIALTVAANSSTIYVWSLAID